MTETTEVPTRRTKRRYAHELYPHALEGQVRPLAVEVPYLYARAVGLEVFGTGWCEAEPKDAGARVQHFVQAREVAFLADALAQGLTGDEAWDWAQVRASCDDSEFVWERAVHYGVKPDRIKPYPCGPEPTTHEHYDERGFGSYVRGREDECPDCTEPVEEEK